MFRQRISTETRSMWGSLITLLIMALVYGCRKSPAPENTTSNHEPDVCAEYNGGTVTATDVNAAVLSLPPGQRTFKDSDPVDWYQSIVEAIVIERLLLENAELLGEDRNPLFLEQEHRLKRTLYSNQVLAEYLEPPSEPVEDQLREWYEEHIDDFHRKESRLVYHIFKRYDDRLQENELRAELSDIRQRALGGENFGILAETYSDSESRHRRGSLGHIIRGQYSADFDNVIFSLEENVPSEPVATADGLHVFYCESVIKEKSFAFDEVRTLVAGRVVEELRNAAIDKLVETLSIDPDAFVPDKDKLSSLLQSHDNSALLLRIGDYHLYAHMIRDLLSAAVEQSGPRPGVLTAAAIFHDIRRREIIFQHCMRSKYKISAAAERMFDAARRKMLITAAARRNLLHHIEQRPDVVEEHYQKNQLRFSTTPRAYLIRCSVPIGSNPSEIMGLLEQSKIELEQKLVTFDDVVKNVGGVREDLGWLPPQELRRTDTKAAAEVYRLEPDSYSHPYRTEESLVLYHVVDVQPASPLPFDSVFGLVVDDYLQSYSQVVYGEFTRKLLEEHNYVLHPEALATLPGGGAASRE